MNLINIVLNRQEVIKHYELQIIQVPDVTLTSYAGYWYIVNSSYMAAHYSTSIVTKNFIRITTEGISRSEYAVHGQDPGVSPSSQVLFRTQELAQRALANLHKYLIKRDTSI